MEGGEEYDTEEFDRRNMIFYFISLGMSVQNKFLFTMTAYQKAKGLLRGWGLGLKINK